MGVVLNFYLGVGQYSIAAGNIFQSNSRGGGALSFPDFGIGNGDKVLIARNGNLNGIGFRYRIVLYGIFHQYLKCQWRNLALQMVRVQTHL